MKGLRAVFLLPVLLLALTVAAEPIDSFSKAKKLMMEKVYFDHRETLYCGAAFDERKRVTLPIGFHTVKHVKRANRVEWEHVVPAENFGRTFIEWRDGHPSCIDSKGKAFKGRNCASKVNKEYRYMQSDLHNLYPSIGAVNGSRSNYNFSILPSAKADFGSCLVKIDNRNVEPPESARGAIARAYLYMEWRYPRYKMSKPQKQLMHTWNIQYPVSEWECIRAGRIKETQGNENVFIREKC